MKSAVFALAALLAAAPAHAQLGNILRAKQAADKIQGLKMSDADERKLGEAVSLKLRDQFGVFQNPAVTKYVSLVGAVLGQESSRPGLAWTFIVLDTDAVNAYAAPGGIVHVTRGLLGLVKSEAELADVLGHEMTHVTAKHTVKSIEKSKMVSLGADEAGGGSLAASAISKLAEAAYTNLLENKFDRNDEMEADRVGVALANQAGYAPTGLTEVLRRLEERNKGAEQSNGLFASHPDTQARLDGISKTIKDQKLNATAVVATRYKRFITFDAVPVSEVPTVDIGARGLTGSSAPKSGDKDKDKKDDKAEEPKKKGGLLGKMGLSGGQQAQSSQTTASAGGRGLGNDNKGKGGDNPAIVIVRITPGDITDFRKGIA